jgi:hypothetical protein
LIEEPEELSAELGYASPLVGTGAGELGLELGLGGRKSQALVEGEVLEPEDEEEVGLRIESAAVCVLARLKQGNFALPMAEGRGRQAEEALDLPRRV